MRPPLSNERSDCALHPLVQHPGNSTCLSILALLDSASDMTQGWQAGASGTRGHIQASSAMQG